MYKFKAFGHENVQAKHLTTIEITKHKDLSLRGDCIIAVSSDFDLTKIKDEIIGKNNAEITLEANDIKETFTFSINQDFNDNEELVFRRSDFTSKRTLGIRSDKSCIDLNKELIQQLKNPKTILTIILKCKNN
jgi:uncharacterized protein